jgi:hypothetical protein
MIFEFAIQHLLAHRQYIVGGIVEEPAVRGDAPQAFVKKPALFVGRWCMAVETRYSPGSSGNGSSIISCQRPKRTITCVFIE